MIVVYDSVGDGDKISKKNLPRFHVTSHLKTEAKVFFSWTVMLMEFMNTI